MHRSNTLKRTSILLTAGALIATMGTAGPLVSNPVPASGDLEFAVAELAATPNQTGQFLLPAGTVVDRVAWDGNVAEIFLTVPAAASNWRLAPLDQEEIGQVLARSFANEPVFGGTRVRIRAAGDKTYDSLDRFLVGADLAPAPAATPDAAFVPTPFAERGPASQTLGFGSPTAQATRQPSGALSGVTVFASAGHGWTADNVVDGYGPDDFTYFLQRPVLLGMCEDYGNIDQLNYFVHYAFNAGATVVPFRPVGWQPIEIVLDNDDPGVTYTGSWNAGDSPKYYENGTTVSGIIYQWTQADEGESATARYTPSITVTDFYPVYCFTIAGGNRTLQTYRIQHSGGLSEVVVDHRLVGNGWIWLGEYYFEAGADNYVEITNASTDAGAIIADAIRWGGGMGDVIRPGPGAPSGYPRDEECQRYWAESELGNNAVGFDSNIWDVPGIPDGSDNVRTGAKWAREMNQEPADPVTQDRWKRIHLEFHTNAFVGTARGQICLITDLGATTYQTEFATILADEVDADMLILDEDFEHSWVDRASPTLTGSYGAIATGANGDEFDATIVELAFHDNPVDAELLRDPRIRSAMAKSCLQGIIRFLNQLPDSEVPLAFAPDTPRFVRVSQTPDGAVTISWIAPLSDGARGDPATGYAIYQSSNGYGFGTPIVVGDQLSVTIDDLEPGETRYFRVAATNAGGESMPTEVLAARRPLESTAETKTILIVNGYDRLRRQNNPIQTLTQPPAYAGDSMERPIWRQSNSFDYVVQHADAIAATSHDVRVVSCSNDAVINSYVQLGNHDALVWILGKESEEDETFSSGERNKVEDFLEEGGGIFLSGSEVGFDLIGQGHGVSFAEDTLAIDYVADDANTYAAIGVGGSILDGVLPFDFDPANGAPYDVPTPDVLGAQSGAAACLNYVGGSGGVAGVQYAGPAYNAVTFGFPFETITSVARREAVMEPVLAFILSPEPPKCFDYNRDGSVDSMDFNIFRFCFQGPEEDYVPGHFCLDIECVDDFDIDLGDFAVLQSSFTGSP